MPLSSTLESRPAEAYQWLDRPRHRHGSSVPRMYWSTAVVDYLA